MPNNYKAVMYTYLPEGGPPQVGAAQQAGEGSFL